ncbi:HEAT repeat domain-containing protein [Bacillus sp. ISL-18]|uniref:HEAT repeat domain-containing protein n=1 Tax=Bacillus sp. ISL-18 TaxID=2819118 RepID=UPI001BE8FD5C|nr:HEAT repeat domain-containing protein [Bacillus sp. ISL-18]MBT2653708.1 HEAT repeat domain-containing protein [Bacillus sp. ISL-18]
MFTNELLFLSILTLSLLVLLVILLGYLTIRKTVEIRKRKKVERYREVYNPLISSNLIEGVISRKLTPESILQQKAIEQLLSRYTKVIEGAEEKARLAKLASMYLSNYYQKQLQSHKWSTRMNTLYHIEDFNMVDLTDDVLRLLNRKRLSQQEIIYILRILALFQCNQLFDLLTTKYQDLTEFDYRHILIPLEQKKFDQYVLHFHHAGMPLQKAIIDVIASKREVSYNHFLEKIFSSYSGEIRLRALKALAEIGYVKDSAPYLELLYSDKWKERLVAAKLIGSLKEGKAIPRLIELLHDRTWWVRSQAGEAISQFTQGKAILQTVLETSTDPFAKDMAWEWLHKGGE